MRRVSIALAAAAAVLLCTVPCRAQALTGYREIDPQTDTAIARARATVNVFVQQLQRPSRSRSTATARVRFANDSVGEHIWLSHVRFDGQYVTGRLSEDADVLPNLHQGDAVRVRPEELTDWMIVDDGWLCGGFTARLSYARMAPDERAAWLQAYRVRRLPAADEVCDSRRETR